MDAPLKWLGNVLGSFMLAMACLLALFIVTWLGTLYQVDHGLHKAQVDYFESWLIAHPIGTFLGVPWKVPLPGGYLIMVVLSINLLVGGLIRLWPRRRRVPGILVTHVGILLLAFGAWLRLHYAEDGRVLLYEPGPETMLGRSEETVYEHYIDWELAVTAPASDGAGREFVFPEHLIDDARPDDAGVVTLRSTAMPLTLRVSHYAPNSRPRRAVQGAQPRVPIAEGYVLEELPREAEAERNVAGLYVEVPEADGGAVQAILWGFGAAPLEVAVGGRPYYIELRKRRMDMPWSIKMVDFVKETHPGTPVARRFSSDVVVTDETGVRRDVHISMNNPFRDRGFVVYQASWGPQDAAPGARLFSVLAVSKNPADRLPWIGVAVIAAGLLWHFLAKFLRFIRRQRTRAAA